MVKMEHEDGTTVQHISTGTQIIQLFTCKYLVYSPGYSPVVSVLLLVGGGLLFIILLRWLCTGKKEEKKKICKNRKKW